MDKGKEQLPEPKEKAIPEEGLPIETVALVVKTATNASSPIARPP